MLLYSTWWDVSPVVRLWLLLAEGEYTIKECKEICLIASSLHSFSYSIFILYFPRFFFFSSSSALLRAISACCFCCIS